MFEKHVSDVLEEIRLFRGEVATFDLIHHLFQFWQLVIVVHGIVPGGREGGEEERKKERRQSYCVKRNSSRLPLSSLASECKATGIRFTIYPPLSSWSTLSKRSAARSGYDL